MQIEYNVSRRIAGYDYLHRVSFGAIFKSLMGDGVHNVLVYIHTIQKHRCSPLRANLRREHVSASRLLTEE